MKLFIQLGIFDGKSKQKKRPSGRFKYGSVTWLCASPNEALLAVATSEGVVSVYPLVCTATNPILTSKEHKDHKITHLKWNSDSTGVFIGDAEGKVTRLNTQSALGHVLVWDPRVVQAAKLLREPVTRIVDLGKNTEIIQVDSDESQVLVSTRYYAYMCSSEHHIYHQIGQKRRNGHHGCCFSSLAKSRALCVRPAFRLWSVDSSGNVLSTLNFKSVIESASHKEVILQEETYDRKRPTTFSKLLPFADDKYILSYDFNFLYLIDPSNVSLVSCTRLHTPLVDLRCVNDNIYVLSSDGCVRHLKWMGAGECATYLYEQELFEECSDFLLKYGHHMKSSISSRLFRTILERVGEEETNDVKEMVEESETCDQTSADWLKEGVQAIVAMDELPLPPIPESDEGSQNLTEGETEDSMGKGCSGNDSEGITVGVKALEDVGTETDRESDTELVEQVEIENHVEKEATVKKKVDRNDYSVRDMCEEKGKVEEDEVNKGESFPISFMWSHHAGASFHSLVAAEHAYSAIQADYYSTDGLKFLATGVQETFNSGSDFLKETFSTLGKTPHPFQVKDEESFPLCDARHRNADLKNKRNVDEVEIEEDFDISALQSLEMEDDPSEFLDESKVEKLMLLTNLVLDYKEESQVDPVIFQELYHKWRTYLSELDNSFKKPALVFNLRKGQVIRKGMKMNATQRCLLTKSFLLFLKHGVPSVNDIEDDYFSQKNKPSFLCFDEVDNDDVLHAKFYRSFSSFLDDDLLFSSVECKENHPNYLTWQAFTDKEVQLKSCSNENVPKILKLVFDGEFDLITKLSIAKSLFVSFPASTGQACLVAGMRPWEIIFLTLSGLEKDEYREEFYDSAFHYLLGWLELACETGDDVDTAVMELFHPLECLYVFTVALLDCSQRGLDIRVPWTAPRCPCGMILPGGLDYMHPFGSLLLCVIDNCVSWTHSQKFQEIMWDYGIFEGFLRLVKQHPDATAESRRRCLQVLYQSGSLDENCFGPVQVEDVKHVASLFTKSKDACVSCGCALGSSITSSWKDLMRFGVAAVGGGETLRIIERYTNQFRLEVSDLRFLSLAVAFEKSQPEHVTKLLTIMSPDTPLKKKVLLERKRNQEHALMLRMFPIVDHLKEPQPGLMWGCRAQLNTWTCPCCSLPILTRALAQDGFVFLFRCGHAYHGICLEVTKKNWCLLCR